MDITSPTLLLDLQKCEHNIKRMAAKARKNNLSFRPHFKTHQSVEVANMLRAQGVEKCTVSSVKMATYFADHGWGDILIAFPANVLEAQKMNELGKRINLQLLVYDEKAVEMLNAKLSVPVGIKVELDLGSRRSGLRVAQHREIDGLLKKIEGAKNLKFTGFYSHPGHTYTARGKEAVRAIYADVLLQLRQLEPRYGEYNGFNITIGDTPGCTISEDFDPIQEISPGNFVFYDVMQVNIGSCSYDDIAVVMACPVVGKDAGRKELLIHGGAVHFSKESLRDNDGKVYFGKLAHPTQHGWSDQITGCYLKSISQEHGLVQVTEEMLQNTHVGDLLYIYPAHSCLAADLMKAYQTTEGAIYLF